MNARERILRAFRLKEGLPDRVPVQFDLSKNHLEFFAKKMNLPMEITDNPYDLERQGWLIPIVSSTRVNCG